ncbi:ABC transporter substrate-binding protein [Bradyrhizobium brasilense]|uniref:ABC transporter substrate-binding protein n=1 Tax=Bradyrhizobium brasilense TaxID=1419277 RepID=UPI0028780669|nr:ABC transporter substrate-binding protein [Bradyrhizobium brasilense]MCP3413871.1 ABC transporter substrate-binding protein [Bradyrhizobium brasilense]
MRQFLAAAIVAAMTTAAHAQVSDDVVRIGVLTDLSSWGRDNSGPGSVEAAKMAVEEFGPTVLGKPIEIISADHQMKTDVGVQVVRGWFDNGKVDAVVDIPNSGIAIAVHNMVRERNKIALLSGPGASSLTDELCSPNTVHFAYDTYALSKVTASAVIKEGGKSWFFVTADYAFGQQAAGTDDPKAVMAKMRELPIEDTFVHGGKLREDGRVIRDMYLAKVKKPSESKEPWDYLDIVKTVKGEDAYRPVSESKCPLLKK